MFKYIVGAIGFVVGGIVKTIGFIITNIFSIIFILCVFAFLLMPTGRKVGKVVVEEAGSYAAQLPKRLEEFTSSRDDSTLRKVTSFFCRSAYSAGSNMLKGAFNTAFYYVGSTAIIAVSVYVMYWKIT